MRLASLLAVLLALTAGAQSPRFRRFTQRTDQGRSGRGLPASSAPFFSFAPATGVGMGAACAGTTPTGTAGEAITFSRASVAECYSNDGQTLTQVASGQPRVSSGRVDSAWLGLWGEDAATNQLWWSRDLSQAQWTKTSMTCTKTATGMRADANSASACTASGANGTVIQSTVLALGPKAGSLHIKRVSGTGGVFVTLDNGTTWTEVTPSLSTSLWRRVVSEEAPGCAGGGCIVVPAMASASLSNPAVGVKLATSGDSVAIDFAQLETTQYPTSPIATVGGTGSRAAEFAYRLTPVGKVWQSLMATYQAPASLFLANGAALPGPAGGSTVAAETNPPAAFIAHGGSLSGYSLGHGYAGVGGPFSSDTISLSRTTGAVEVRTQYGSDTLAGAMNSATSQYIVLGSWSSTAGTINGVVKGVCIDTDPNRCVRSRVPTLVWVGDSIIWGQATPAPPTILTGLLGRYVVNGGNPGDTTSQCATRWTSTYRATSAATLIWSCGINDVSSGLSGATAAANAIAVFNDALSLGKAVIVTGISPWGTAVAWTAGKQTETDTYNSTVQAWAVANGQKYVSTAGLGTGSPLALLAGYDYGDHFHYNAAGNAYFAGLVQAVNP